MSFRNLKKVIGKLKKKVTTVSLTKSEMDAIANEAVTRIVTIVRMGRSPKDDSKLLPLAQSTIERRKELSKYNATHEAYSPKKSNLTFTGEFLDSISPVIDYRNFIIEILPRGTHKPYRGKKGKTGGSAKNIDILRGQKALGRDFLGLNAKTKKRIIEMALRFYRKKLTKKDK